VKKLLLASTLAIASFPGYAADSPRKELQDWMAECTNWETGEGCPKRPLSKDAQALSDMCSEAGDEEAIGKCIDASHPARVTVQPPYQGPPPIGWVYKPYTRCPFWPVCSTVVVSVEADGLNVRVTPNGPAIMALVDGTPITPIRFEGNWVLVAPACDLTPTWAWSWNTGVPLNRCWVYF
jgi:hypothetical protein